ncbi:MAG TPA: permease prefix domain 1-containing protein, partial [Gemmatimonadales bacterium]
MPDFAGEIRRRLAPLTIRAEREAEIVDELTQHLEDRVRDLCGAGVSLAEAEAAALAELEGGDVLVRAVAAVERR